MSFFSGLFCSFCHGEQINEYDYITNHLFSHRVLLQECEHSCFDEYNLKARKKGRKLKYLKKYCYPINVLNSVYY